jgi:hypothetical protein
MLKHGDMARDRLRVAEILGTDQIADILMKQLPAEAF